MLRDALRRLAWGRSRRLPPGTFVHQWEVECIAAAVAQHLAEVPAMPEMLRLVAVEHAPGEGGRLVDDIGMLLREVARLRPEFAAEDGPSPVLRDSRAAGAMMHAVFTPAEGIPPGHGRLAEVQTPLRPPDARVAGWVRHCGETGPRLEPQLTPQERDERLIAYWPGWGPLQVGTGPGAHLWGPTAGELSLEAGGWRVEVPQGSHPQCGAEVTVQMPGLTLHAQMLPRALRLRHALALAGPEPGVVLAVAGRLPPLDGADEIAPGLWLSGSTLLVHQRTGVRVNGADTYLDRITLGELRRLEVAPGGHPYGSVPLVAKWDGRAGVLRFRPPYGVNWHLRPSDQPLPEWRIQFRRGSHDAATGNALVLPFGDRTVPPDASVTVLPVAAGALRVTSEGVPVRLAPRHGNRWGGIESGSSVQLEPPAEFAIGGTLFRVDPTHLQQSGKGS